MVEKTKNIYQQFYTKSIPIVEYMISRLSISKEDTILEPCAGDGVFIDSILSAHPDASITANELNSEAFKLLDEKYSKYENVIIRQSDFLMDIEWGFSSFDKIIANPPYGAWQDYSKRKTLKVMFPNMYVKETYTVFLYKCIEMLKLGGRLVFIIPDTFLNLHLHKHIRNIILKNTKIVEILLFPSSFFPNVNFGYANLSIITLERDSDIQENLQNEFKIYYGFDSVDDLSGKRSSKNISLTQKDVLDNSGAAFYINEDKSVLDCLKNTKLCIGDIAACVTGFYSGNDKQYLKVGDVSQKNGNKYELINDEAICYDAALSPNILDGLKGDNIYVSIVKGGNVRFLKPDNWFMTWSEKSVKNYKTHRKARFQNSKYYFKSGIAVPMISSSQITASLIEEKLFDQSIVGIFPNDEGLMYYLLAFFNSKTCNKLIRTINPSANNPANYIKKIPFIPPPQGMQIKINSIVNEILNSIKTSDAYKSQLEDDLSECFKEIYGF